MVDSITRIENGLKVKFSEQQLNIITSVGVPTNVISLAGSGKTTTLLARLFYMEFEYDIKPYNMLAITFSNSASKDMSTRYKKARQNLKLSGYSPCFKTFHALFKSMISINPKYKSIKVATIKDYKFDLLKLIRVGSELIKNDEILENMNSYRGWLINESKSIDGIANADKYFEKQPRTFELDAYLTVMKEYQRLKDEDRAIDFDDMQYICYDELMNGEYGEKMRTEFQELYLQVMIDEYQDICPIQVQIMDELIGANVNSLEAIGDDDQCVYSFRGGDPKFIINFEFNYPNAKRLFLSTNYRCPIEVLQFAAPLIMKNQFRVEKDIYAVKEGGEVKIIDTKRSQDEFLNEIRIDLLTLDAKEHETLAILVRENSARTLIGDRLIREGIPVDMSSNKWYLYNTSVWKRIMSIIKMVKWSDNHLLKSIGWTVFPYMKRDILKTYENSKALWVEDCLSGAFNTEPKVLRIIESMLEEENASKLINYAYELVRKSYESGAKKGHFNMDNIKEQVDYIEYIAEGLTMDEFELNIKDTKTKLDNFIDSPKAVKILTMHSVKGLEFTKVYIMGVSDDVFLKNNVLVQYVDSHADLLKLKKEITEGNYRSKDLQMYVEEERRVLYVALTRCKKKTVIVHDSSKSSLFLTECLSGHKEGSVLKLDLDKKDSNSTIHDKKELGTILSNEADNLKENGNSLQETVLAIDEDNVETPMKSKHLNLDDIILGDTFEDLASWNELEILTESRRSVFDFEDISLDDLDTELSL